MPSIVSFWVCQILSTTLRSQLPNECDSRPPSLAIETIDIDIAFLRTETLSCCNLDRLLRSMVIPILGSALLALIVHLNEVSGICVSLVSVFQLLYWRNVNLSLRPHATHCGNMATMKRAFRTL
jgi:hypothetical protein